MKKLFNLGAFEMKNNHGGHGETRRLWFEKLILSVKLRVLRGKILICWIALITILLSACISSDSKVQWFPFGSNGDKGGAVEINFNEFKQVIDGFGGSNAWTRLPSDSEDANELTKLLYSKTEGMGFTILRNRIPFRERLPGDVSSGLDDGFVVRKADHNYDYTVNPDGTKTFKLNWNSWDLSGTKSLIQNIKSLGNKGPEKLVILSTPWTPPNNRVTQWKENITGVNARLNYVMDWSLPDRWGRLKRAHYNDYADLLADYVKNFESQMGAPLDILSVQNEPNWKADWECAYWDGIDLRDFIKIIAQRFPMKGITLGEDGLGIMMPEYENLNINFNNMIKPSLDDPESERIITHIGMHQYNAGSDSSSRAGAREFPEIIESGKRFWQTEISGSGRSIPTGHGILNALFWARMIHWDLTLMQTNAFLYWWLWTNTESTFDNGGSLVFYDGYEIIAADRLYAMGQYSRFIRPGWFRIASTVSPSTGLYSSTYRNPNTKEIAIVMINERITPSVVSLNLTGAEFDRLEAWRTSENEKLRSVGSRSINSNKTDVVLAPLSITTFYGSVK
ncbi:MAG: hypothetical protein FWD13_09695 [Treponema sp.]|nr:hypothetical protein [Treponema sp.]